jgi:site-specific recombinase XerD
VVRKEVFLLVTSEHLTLLKPQRYTPLQASLDAFLLSKQAARCTAKTLIHYRYTVGNFVGFLHRQRITELEQITPKHIRRFLVELQRQGLKDTTQHAHARGIKAWLRWLVAEGDLEESPMKRVEMPRLEQRVPPPFSPEDVRKLLAACDRKTDTGRRNYAIVLCLLDSGLRLAEFASLQLSDINLRTGIVSVRRGKGGKQRQTRFGAKARGALVRFLATQQCEPGEPLWGLSPRGIQIMLYRLGKRAHVQPCGPHRFRRTFCLWCMRSGMDLHSLRMLMGHSDLSILQRYLALAGEDIERAHVAHSPVDRLLAGR